MKFEICTALEEVTAAEWNALIPDNNPFLRHEFLVALERHGCVSAKFGWYPRHLLGFDHLGRVVAAVPAYIKENSYGEFVFDHAWAQAYQANGMRYYPKLVCAVPYTPATGQRILIAPDQQIDDEQLIASMSQLVDQLALKENLSSTHWLFLTKQEVSVLKKTGLGKRVGVQFHWQNSDYQNFDHFLSQLTSKRRKSIRRERRAVEDQGLRLRVLHGDEVSKEEWELFTWFYNKTFEERFSLPTLNAGFFSEIGETLAKQVILVLAYDGEECVAGALMFRSDSTLYGRHWGCSRDYHSLHFEACYYQGIEYCIQHKLKTFEPGAQGEHKIWRGFMPTLTYSMHRLYHPGFSEAIADFLLREEPAMLDYKESLLSSSPFSRAKGSD